MEARKNVGLIVVVFLVLSLILCVGAADSELRLNFGILSYEDESVGNCGFIVGGDYLFHLGDSPFGIAGGLKYISSANTTFYSDTVWRDIATTLSFFYFPSLTEEVYFGMGLEYHWAAEKVIYLDINNRNLRKESGLGLHFVMGFNLGEHIFLEGKIGSVGIGYRNEGGISLQIGGRFNCLKGGRNAKEDKNTARKYGH